MQQTAITIVGSLDPAAEKRALQVAQAAAGVSLTPVILAPGQAVDILLPAGGAALETRLRQAFADFGPFDVFVQPHDAFRRKKLLVADMDATMVEGETLDDVAGKAGIKEQVALITQAGMRGEIDFAESLRRRIALLEGLPFASFMQTLAETRPTKGAAAVVRTMKRHGARCVLVSGGFDCFTTPIAAQIGFDAAFGNRLVLHGDRLTGEVSAPILGAQEKKQILIAETRRLGIELAQVLSVGDGANDIPMLQTVGAGVGYFAKAAVIAATPHQIRHTGLQSLLFMQGYRADECLPD